MSAFKNTLRFSPNVEAFWPPKSYMREDEKEDRDLFNLTCEVRKEVRFSGVSFGLTLNLLKFWKRAAFVPVYLRQSANDLTGEHTCIMLKTLSQGLLSPFKHFYAESSPVNCGTQLCLCC